MDSNAIPLNSSVFDDKKIVVTKKARDLNLRTSDLNNFRSYWRIFRDKFRLYSENSLDYIDADIANLSARMGIAQEEIDANKLFATKAGPIVRFFAQKKIDRYLNKIAKYKAKQDKLQRRYLSTQYILSNIRKLKSFFNIGEREAAIPTNVKDKLADYTKDYQNDYNKLDDKKALQEAVKEAQAPEETASKQPTVVPAPEEHTETAQEFRDKYKLDNEQTVAAFLISKGMNPIIYENLKDQLKISEYFNLDLPIKVSEDEKGYSISFGNNKVNEHGHSILIDKSAGGTLVLTDEILSMNNNGLTESSITSGKFIPSVDHVNIELASATTTEHPELTKDNKVYIVNTETELSEVKLGKNIKNSGIMKLSAGWELDGNELLPQKYVGNQETAEMQKKYYDPERLEQLLNREQTKVTDENKESIKGNAKGYIDILFVSFVIGLTCGAVGAIIIYLIK